MKISPDGMCEVGSSLCVSEMQTMLTTLLSKTGKLGRASIVTFQRDRNESVRKIMKIEHASKVAPSGQLLAHESFEEHECHIVNLPVKEAGCT